jgi:hypothetical protein
MTIETELRALAAGEAADPGLLLQTARAHAFGVPHYGREEIVQAFRRRPIVGEPQWIEAEGHAALLWDDRALIADVAGPHVARLWRIGPDAALPREPSVGVPFDPDLAQVAGDDPFVAADHGLVSDAHGRSLSVAMHALGSNWRDIEGVPAARVRSFCLRAFGSGASALGLLAVHLLEHGSARAAGYVHVAIAVGAAGSRLIRDGADEELLGTAPWRPRLR